MTEPVMPPGLDAIEDPPSPDLAALEQRTEAPMPAIPVHVEGVVLVQQQPARIGTVAVEYMSTTAVKVLPDDLKRSFALLVSGTAWLISTKGPGGSWAPIPANVPVPVTHASEVWAKVASSSEVQLTVIVETYAQ